MFKSRLPQASADKLVHPWLLLVLRLQVPCKYLFLFSSVLQYLVFHCCANLKVDRWNLIFLFCCSVTKKTARSWCIIPPEITTRWRLMRSWHVSCLFPVNVIWHFPFNFSVFHCRLTVLPIFVGGCLQFSLCDVPEFCPILNHCLLLY